MWKHIEDCFELASDNTPEVLVRALEVIELHEGCVAAILMPAYLRRTSESRSEKHCRYDKRL
jgi:hypothetical protein